MEMPRWKPPDWKPPNWNRSGWQKPDWLKRKNAGRITALATATALLGLFAFVIMPGAILKICFVAAIAAWARAWRGSYFERTESAVLMKRRASLKQLPPRLKQRVRTYETTVTYWRKHPASLFFEGGILIPLGIGVVTGAVVGVKTHLAGNMVLWFILGSILADLARAGWRYPEWSIRYYCVTTKRMIMTKGIFSHSGPEIPLAKFLGREPIIPWHSHLLYALHITREKYGTFFEETAGSSKEIGESLDHITYIPYVWAVYGEVTDMQYKSKDDAKDDGT